MEEDSKLDAIKEVMADELRRDPKHVVAQGVLRLAEVVEERTKTPE